MTKLAYDLLAKGASYELAFFGPEMRPNEVEGCQEKSSNWADISNDRCALSFSLSLILPRSFQHTILNINCLIIKH